MEEKIDPFSFGNRFLCGELDRIDAVECLVRARAQQHLQPRDHALFELFFVDHRMTPRSTSIILGAPLNLNTQFMSPGRARRCGPAQGRDDSGYAERAFETCFFHTRGITTGDGNSPFSAIPANASASTRSRSLPWFRPRSDGPTKCGNCGRLCPSHSARLDAAENVGVCWSLHALVESQNRPVSERPRIASNLLSFERHAFIFSNAGLEFLIGHIRAAIVGSQLTSLRLSQRSEPMADDDRR